MIFKFGPTPDGSAFARKCRARASVEQGNRVRAGKKAQKCPSAAMVRMAAFARSAQPAKAGNSCVIPYSIERPCEKFFYWLDSLVLTCTGLYCVGYVRCGYRRATTLFFRFSSFASFAWLVGLDVFMPALTLRLGRRSLQAVASGLVAPADEGGTLKKNRRIGAFTIGTYHTKMGMQLIK
jgi:hypothetical protein